MLNFKNFFGGLNESDDDKYLKYHDFKLIKTRYTFKLVHIFVQFKQKIIFFSVEGKNSLMNRIEIIRYA